MTNPRNHAILLLLLVAQIASASPADAIATRFIDVLRRDDPAAAASLVAADLKVGEWNELRDLVSRFDCINVSRYETTLVHEEAKLMTLRVDLDGSAELKADWRPQRRLARTWHIDARMDEGEWRVTRVITEARRVALAMYDAPDDAEAEGILVEATQVDACDVLPQYAALLEFGRPARRYERIEHAADMARRMADVSTEIQVLRRHCDPLTRARDPRAVDVMQRLRGLARNWGSQDDLAGMLLSIGLVRLRTEGAAPAADTYASCASLAEGLDDPTTAIKCEQMFFTCQPGVLQALAPIDRIDKLSRRYGWEEGKELVLTNRALSHATLGDVDRVYAVFLETLALTERHGNRRSVAEAMANLAVIDLGRGRYAEAVKWLRESLSRFGPNFSIERALAETLIAMGDLDEAERLIRRTEPESITTLDRALFAAHMARVHVGRGQLDSAVARASEALQLVDPTVGWNEFSCVTGALTTRARAFRKAGRLAEAEADARSAVELIEMDRERIGGDALTRALAHQDSRITYVDLVEILIEQGKIEEALRIAEQMKARGLRHALSGGRIDISASMSASERARETTLQKNLIDLNRELIRARQAMQPFESIEAKLVVARRELDTFRTELSLKHPRRRAAEVEASPALPAGAEEMAAVEYLVTDAQVFAFVLTRDAMRMERLPLSRETVEREALEVAELIAARAPGYAAPAKRLHAMLLAPLEKHLGDARVVAIIPDGVLWTVPFHALIAANGVPEIDRRAVFYAHSLSLLNAANEAHPSAESTLLAFGNPAIGATARATLRSASREVQLGSLEAAEEEVRSLSTMYSRERSRVFCRDQAKEAVFKEEAPRYGILHVAAHAIVDDRAPMYSAIVLAQSGEAADDGLLEAREVVDLPLHAELAVLSACETARGRVGKGEGMIGLAWAFSAAGVPTTIVSQWNAESSATAKVMVEMHRRLLDGETIANALRGAQLAVRREPRYRHPFYWAPFVAIGAGGRELASR